MPGTRFTVTVVVENAPREGFVDEHGLAFWIETQHGTILFDTGQGNALIPNAQKLNLNLDAVQFLALSHGHYDHTGAVVEFLTRAPGAMVVHHPEIYRTRYSIAEGKDPRDISIPAAAAAAIRALPSLRICSSRAPVEMVPNVGTTGEIPRATTYEDVGGPFFLDTQRKTPDTIPDDQSLWFLTNKGLVILCGCAHSGIVNTVHQARRVTGEHRIAGLIGGFHLNAASEERLVETAKILQDWNVGFVMPCHCTGASATDFLREAMGSRVTPVGMGDVLKF